MGSVSRAGLMMQSTRANTSKGSKTARVCRYLRTGHATKESSFRMIYMVRAPTLGLISEFTKVS
jgi:hypothetical protein